MQPRCIAMLMLVKGTQPTLYSPPFTVVGLGLVCLTEYP